MKSIRQIARIISGLVFIFSGLSKGVDPMGSMYKFIDYFTAFGMDALNGLALVLGILLCTAEFIIGFAILTGIRVKEASWGLLLFMAVFTPLTFILAINNPVSDCGCFGDAIHLSNWQTFYKNIIILAFVLIVFFQRNKFIKLSLPRTEWLILAVSTLVFLIFIQLNYRHLPFIDFRPYSTGTNIAEDMSIPDNAPIDEYEVFLIYEKDGEAREFTLENYPSDSTWVFVDQKSTLVKKGYVPPIHDFNLTSVYGDDLTDLVLDNSGYTLIMASLHLSEAQDGLIESGIELGTELQEAGFDFYILTSSTTDDVLAYNRNELFLSADETTIKTIIRSNPGMILIGNGEIIKKWSHSSVPDATELIDKLEKYEKNMGANAMLRLFLLMALIAAFSYVTALYLVKKKNY